MYTILIDLPEKLRDFLTLKFLTMGIKLFIGESQKQVTDIVEKHGPCYIFVNLNTFNNPWLPFLAHIRQYKNDDEYKFVILSNKTDREFVQTLLLLNVEGLIPANLEIEEIYKRLDSILTKQGSANNNKREYERVVPRENDDISMSLSVPNSSIILTGKVLNISIGGIAFQLENKGESRWLDVGLVIESAQLKLNRKLGITGIKIVAIKDNLVGGRFVKSTDFFYNLLGRYLLERISNG